MVSGDIPDFVNGDAERFLEQTRDPARSYPNAALGEAVPMLGHEFDIDSVRYRYEGPAYRGYAFTSTDQEGAGRMFFVYQSKSEGGWRASQGAYLVLDDPLGRTPFIRFIKGAEVYEGAHYTQDTQLHPAFEDALWEIVDNDIRPRHPDLAGVYDDLHDHLTRLLTHDEHSRDQAHRDFHNQITRVPLGSRELHDLLGVLRPGYWRTEHMADRLGMPADDPAAVWQTYEDQLERLNNYLIDEGLMPDFSAAPQAARRFSHPLLGPCYTEVFTREREGHTFEWHMSRDLTGRVWIDRIRLSDSPPTAYGTDAHVVASGILTSKPIEHNAAVAGIPEAQRPAMGTSYSDITSLLNRLEPVRQYRAHYPSRRGNFEDRTPRI